MGLQKFKGALNYRGLHEFTSVYRGVEGGGCV